MMVPTTRVGKRGITPPCSDVDVIRGIALSTVVSEFALNHIKTLSLSNIEQGAIGTRMAQCTTGSTAMDASTVRAERPSPREIATLESGGRALCRALASTSSRRRGPSEPYYTMSICEMLLDRARLQGKFGR